MTLTLLLQLTDEEQLFASAGQPVLLPASEELVQADAVPPAQDECAQWPADREVNS
ncbi:MAG: hypothetical protein JST98_00330 [Bacteroidetes bacterium]|nr:hypothetical protein [Bacteroidota bacterium]MBS1943663.1 hypothetical protein [Bacteroidota bacterium]